MKVILLENEKCGALGEQVVVKPGFARNYLIPMKKAVMATPENIEMFQQKRAEFEQRAQERLALSEQKAEKVRALEQITLKARVAEGGKLYGSISSIEVIRALKEAGVGIPKKDLRMPQGAIREIGEFPIEVHFPAGVVVPLTIIVSPLSA